MREFHAEIFSRFNDPLPGGATRDENVFRPSGPQQTKVCNGPGRSKETPEKARKLFEKWGRPGPPPGKSFLNSHGRNAEPRLRPGNPERARSRTHRSRRADGGPGTQTGPRRHGTHATPGQPRRQTAPGTSNIGLSDPTRSRGTHPRRRCRASAGVNDAGPARGASIRLFPQGPQTYLPRRATEERGGAMATAPCRDRAPRGAEGRACLTRGAEASHHGQDARREDAEWLHLVLLAGLFFRYRTRRVHAGGAPKRSHPGLRCAPGGAGALTPWSECAPGGAEASHPGRRARARQGAP